MSRNRFYRHIKTMKNNYTERIKTAVSKAIEGDSNITDEIRVLEGCSSPKIRHLLNNLIKSGDRYLEVGCYKGSTSISSLYSKHVDDYFLIDNYSEFPSQLGPEGTKNAFLNNFTKIIGNPPKNFYNMDYKNIDANEIQNINVYLYDGHHSYNEHKSGITHFYKSFADEFILCVDDWDTSGWGVREGTYDAISELGLEILYKVELEKGSIVDSNFAHLDDKWWFGFAVFHLKK